MLHQQPKMACGRRSFCNQHQSACLAIESVYDRNLSPACDLECEQLAQFLPQRGRAVGLVGMNEKKWWLIDDDVVIRLIDDFKLECWSDGVME